MKGWLNIPENPLEALKELVAMTVVTSAYEKKRRDRLVQIITEMICEEVEHGNRNS